MMKNIILISAIFYLIGLKISNSFDFLRKLDSTPNIIEVPANEPPKTEKSFLLKSVKSEVKSPKQVKDSVNRGGSSKVAAPEIVDETKPF